jgi:hypothetical protein
LEPINLKSIDIGASIVMGKIYFTPVETKNEIGNQVEPELLFHQICTYR